MNDPIDPLASAQPGDLSRRRFGTMALGFAGLAALPGRLLAQGHPPISARQGPFRGTC
jgi:hypothetical protein